jgi:hypothetical protein
MTANISSLEEVIENLRAAIKLLGAAEQQWPDALRTASADIPEFGEVEERLHYSRLKVTDNLAFLAQDIEALLARVRVRRKYASFNMHHFKRVVQEGWSLSLLQDLQRAHPGTSLLELSNRMKQLREEWGCLPYVIHSKQSG